MFEFQKQVVAKSRRIRPETKFHHNLEKALSSEVLSSGRLNSSLLDLKSCKAYPIIVYTIYHVMISSWFRQETKFRISLTIRWNQIGVCNKSMKVILPVLNVAFLDNTLAFLIWSLQFSDMFLQSRVDIIIFLKHFTVYPLVLKLPFSKMKLRKLLVYFQNVKPPPFTVNWDQFAPNRLNIFYRITFQRDTILRISFFFLGPEIFF